VGTPEKNRPHSQFSRIWAAARELGMSSDEIHDIVGREYGKDSLKKLTARQTEKLGNLLWDMARGRPSTPRPRKRTDEGGRPDNIKQRRKIFKLAEVLGWNEDSINQFSLSEYGVSRHEWLPPDQCSNMIEAMKAIAERDSKAASKTIAE
jgi:hypothetical protein